jgi:hypothetical protein
MRTTNLVLSTLCGLLISSAILVSCSKENTESLSATEKEEFATTASEADIETEAVSNDVFDNAMGVNSEVALGGTGVFGSANMEQSGGIYGPSGIDSLTRCFNVSVVRLDANALFPVRVTIDFGAGCTGPDGRTRKGKIITTYTKRLLLPGAVATTTFDGYYINNVKVEGTHKITNVSTDNKFSFKIEISGKLTNADGNYREWSSVKTLTMVEGSTTITPQDDVFSLTGTATGIVKKADKLYQWSTEITSPLIKRFNCRWIVQGSITHKKGDTRVSVLNYGEGDCDNQASLTVNSQTRIITLH